MVEYGDGKILMHDMEDKDASQLPQFREREAVQGRDIDIDQSEMKAESYFEMEISALTPSQLYISLWQGVC